MPQSLLYNYNFNELHLEEQANPKQSFNFSPLNSVNLKNMNIVNITPRLEIGSENWTNHKAQDCQLQQSKTNRFD